MSCTAILDGRVAGESRQQTCDQLLVIAGFEFDAHLQLTFFLCILHMYV